MCCHLELRLFKGEAVIENRFSCVSCKAGVHIENGDPFLLWGRLFLGRLALKFTTMTPRPYMLMVV